MIKKTILMILIIIIYSPAWGAFNFNYVGKEDINKYSKLNEVYPPLSLELTKKINLFNITALLNSSLGSLYVSHGCIHISPAASYILYTILPVNTPVFIKTYNVPPPDNLTEVPELANLICSNDDLQKMKTSCADPSTIKIVIYQTRLGLLYLNGKITAKFDVLSGPPNFNYPFLGVEKNALTFDKNLATPTPDGPFKICKKTDYFYAALYPEASLLEQDTQVVLQDNTWKCWNEKKQKWDDLPQAMAKDLDRTDDDFAMLWYDIKRNKEGKIYAAKWGGHPFGKHALLLMDENNVITSILIHTNGELLLEEQELLYYITDILASETDTTWEQFMEDHPAVSQMQYIADFVHDPLSADFVPNRESSLYKYANDLPLSFEEKPLIPAYYFLAQNFCSNAAGKTAYNFTQEDKKLLQQLGTQIDKAIPYKMYGTYYDALSYNANFRKTALWFNSLKAAWTTLVPLKSEFNAYFKKNGIDSTSDRGKIIYALLNARLRYNYVSSLTLSQFLKN